MRPALAGRAGLAGLTGVTASLVVWEVAARAAFSAADVPPASAVLPRAAELLGEPDVRSAAARTALVAAEGLLIAAVAGIALGLLLGSVPWLLAVTASTLDFLRPVPSVVLIPVLVLAMTVTRATVVLVAVACFWIVLFQVLYGVREIDPVARDTTRAYRFGPWMTLRHLTVPTVLPQLMTALRLVVSVALALAVTGGLVMGAPTLGALIWAAEAGGDVVRMYGLVLLTGALGVLADLGARAVERRAVHWHVSVRRDLVAP